ncbi:olfactory receptor 1L4-like [Salvelinus alpinus]
MSLDVITYLLIITVNLTLIITIIQEKGLHEPMYIFLCSLCVNGLYGTAGFYPKLLLDLQSDVQVISYVTLFDTLQGWNSSVNITLNMRNAMAVQFLVIPPVLNPVIYGLNLKQIRRAVFRKFPPGGIDEEELYGLTVFS